MDNVQNCNSYTDIPSSQTYRSYLQFMPRLSGYIFPSRFPVGILYAHNDGPEV
jgi:hypothetical protein